jgi:glycosyltransferase involved in cell wall biosynthesis
VKILYLCPDLGIPVLGRKGASVHVRELIAALQRAGHRVTLAAQMLHKSPWDKPAEINAPVLQVRPAPGALAAVQTFKAFNELIGVENSLPGELRRILYNEELAGELRRRFDNDPPDFIYERASLYATAGVALARSFGVPLIVELNAPLAVEQTTYRATGFGELAAHAERWSLTHADAVVVVSSGLRAHVASLGVKAEKIHVLPNGVNPELFFPSNNRARQPVPLRAAAARRNDGAHDTSRPTLGFVGGLRPWHGVEVLPELLARLNRRHRGLRLVIAGDGQLRSSLERDFRKRGLERSVTFTGLIPHEEIPATIRGFDVALAPYPRPQHDFYFSPLKLFEYMACGVPVVAARIGQIAEVVTDGKTGLLYPPGDLDALESRCDELLGSARRRTALGRAAARLVHQQFTWEINAARVGELARALRASPRQ